MFLFQRSVPEMKRLAEIQLYIFDFSTCASVSCMDLYKLQEFNSSDCWKTKDRAKLKNIKTYADESFTEFYQRLQYSKVEKCNLESSTFLLSNFPCLQHCKNLESF